MRPTYRFRRYASRQDYNAALVKLADNWPHRPEYLSPYTVTIPTLNLRGR